MTPKEKGQTTIYKTVDRKQKISQTTRGEIAYVVTTILILDYLLK
jgi:hypothetical protein